MKPNVKKSNRRIAYLFFAIMFFSTLGWVFTQYLDPYLQQLGSIEMASDQTEQQIANLQLRIENSPTAKEDQSEVLQDIIRLQQGYVTDLNQEDVLLLLDMLAAQNGVRLGLITFEDLNQSLEESYDSFQEEARQYFSREAELQPVFLNNAAESPGVPAPLPLDELRVSLRLYGTYNDCLSLIQSLENLPYDMAITGCSMVPDEGSVLRTTLDLWFFALPNTFDQNNRIAEVTYTDFRLRENPFEYISH